MASLADLILGQVTSAASGIQIPSNVKQQALNGLSDSILGSLTQTAAKAGGIEQIRQLLTGKSNAASSPITALATKIFTGNVLNKLNLGNSGSALSALIPVVMGKLSGLIQDRDGDGDVDLNDILLSLKGGSSASSGSGILGAATSILGGLLRKK